VRLRAARAVRAVGATREGEGGRLRLVREEEHAHRGDEEKERKENVDPPETLEQRRAEEQHEQPHA